MLSLWIKTYLHDEKWKTIFTHGEMRKFSFFLSHILIAFELDWLRCVYLLPTVIKADRNPSRPFLAFRRESCQPKALLTPEGCEEVGASNKVMPLAGSSELRITTKSDSISSASCSSLNSNYPGERKSFLFLFIKQSQLFFVFDRRHHNNGREKGEKMVREIDGVHSATSVVHNLYVVTRSSERGKKKIEDIQFIIFKKQHLRLAAWEALKRPLSQLHRLSRSMRNAIPSDSWAFFGIQLRFIFNYRRVSTLTSMPNAPISTPKILSIIRRVIVGKARVSSFQVLINV